GGRYWALRREGKYWVSSVHSGDPTDSVDATAIVTRWGWPNAKEAHERPFRAQVIALAPRQPWVRRANLLETTNAFLRVERTGKYEVRSEEHTSELQSLRHLVCRLQLE